MLYPTLTPLNHPFLHTGVWTSKDLLNVDVIGHRLLTSGSVYTLTEKNQKHFTIQLEMGPSHKFKYE